MRALRGVFVVLALALPVPLVAADLRAGLDAYERGDYATALTELRPLAEQGDPAAQLNLGLMYANGSGVPQDYAEAVKWYRLTAEQGHVEAQFTLGVLYGRGLGVPQNYVEAAKWFRRAAEQRHKASQHILANYYADGQGVPQNHAEAYFWYSLAATGGSSAAAEWRDKMIPFLPQTVLLDVQVRAQIWQPTPEVHEGGVGQEERRGPSPSPISATQRRLAHLGYAPGPADGIVGPRTRAAIRAFQQEHGMPVDGQVSVALLEGLLATTKEAPLAAPPVAEEPQLVGTGSGFVVSTDGHLLTNDHVVRDCTQVRVSPRLKAQVISSHLELDLALLKTAQSDRHAAKFRVGGGIRTGDSVVGAGFPLPESLASDLNVTTGTVNALTGIGGDRRFIQISAPVQPGNSGGPLLDLSGNIVGIIVGKLDAIQVAKVTGDIPQNVNFAISAFAARFFLNVQGVAYNTARSQEDRPVADIAAEARGYTVRVECWK